MLDPVIHKMITYVQNLEEKDLKDKVGAVYIYPFLPLEFILSNNDVWRANVWWWHLCFCMIIVGVVAPLT